MWFWLQFENSDHTTNQRTEQSHTITHTHTYLLQGIIGKIIVLNLRAEVTINNLIFLASI